jgi:hypothetical protein
VAGEELAAGIALEALVLLAADKSMREQMARQF